MTKTNNEGWGLGSKEGDGAAKPITAWAVETDGSILPTNVFSTRSLARYIRNIVASQGYTLKASVRKVQIIKVPGC